MIIGAVTIFQCDSVGCETVKILTSDAPHEEFSRDWFIGTTEDFCPPCRHKIENQAAIAAQEAEISAAGARVLDHVRTKVKEAAC